MANAYSVVAGVHAPLLGADIKHYNYMTARRQAPVVGVRVRVDK